MRKIVILAIIGIIGLSSLSAQTFTNQDRVVNIGTGFGAASWSGVGYSIGFPPLSVMYEQGIYEKTGPGYFGFGGFASLSGSRYKATVNGVTYKSRYTYFTLGARGAYHLNMNELLSSNDFTNLDIYGGLQFNIVFIGHSYVGDHTGYQASGGSDFYPGLFIGGRYYFKNNIGAFTELGYNSSYLTLGVCFRL